MATAIVEPQRLKHETREEWLATRQSGIGGSDAAAVLGLSPWSDPFSVFAEKTGLVEGSAGESEAMQWGHLLEGTIAAEFGRRTKRMVYNRGEFTILRSGTHPWMLATLDREIDDERLGPGVLEVKNVGAHQSANWDEEPPLHYQIQLQHQLVVAGVPWGSLVALVGGQELRYFDIELNEKFAKRLVEIEEEFWQACVAGNPPPVNGSESCIKTLSRLHADDSGETISLPGELVDVDEQLQIAKAEIKKWSEQKDELEARIKAAIGSNTFGLLGQVKYSWKTQERAGYTVQPSKSRVLRRSVPKGK